MAIVRDERVKHVRGRFFHFKGKRFGLTGFVSQQAVKGWATVSQTIETNMIKHTQSCGRGAGDSQQTSFTCAEQVLVSGVCGVGQVFAYIRAPNSNPGVQRDLSKEHRKNSRLSENVCARVCVCVWPPGK